MNFFYLSLWYVFVLKSHLSLSIYINHDCKSLVKPKKQERKENYDNSARKKKKTMTCIRAYLIRNHQTHMTHGMIG